MMIVNSPWATSASAGVQASDDARDRPSTAEPRPTPTLPTTVSAMPTSEHPAEVVERGQVDREPEDEEEERRENVAEREEALFDLLADAALREHDPRHQRSDGLRDADLVGQRRHPDHEPEHREQEELEVQPGQQPADLGAKQPCGRERASNERERGRADAGGVREPAAAGGDESEQHGDGDSSQSRMMRTRSVSSSASRRKSASALTAIALDET